MRFEFSSNCLIGSVNVLLQLSNASVQLMIYSGGGGGYRPIRFEEIVILMIRVEMHVLSLFDQIRTVECYWYSSYFSWLCLSNEVRVLNYSHKYYRAFLV